MSYLLVRCVEVDQILYRHSKMDTCRGFKGEDICHLAKGVQKIDFTTIPALRKQLVEQTKQEAKQEAQQDERVKIAKQAVDAAFPKRKRDASETAPSLRVNVPRLKAKTQSLTNEEIKKAQMVRASKTAHDKGFAAAQEEIDSGPLRGWRIDRELSNRESLVLVDGTNAEVVIAYRGTRFNNANDLVTDALAIMGKESAAPQIRASHAQMEEVRLKYNQLPSELIGYSKGGVHAMTLGDAYSIPSTTFNPLIGPSQLLSRSEVAHSIVRTVEDPVSVGLALARSKRNYTVKAIDTLYGIDDPKTVHDLKHFTRAGARQPGGIDRLSKTVLLKGQELGHLEVLDAMKTGVEQNKTFTESLDDFNAGSGLQRVDVLEDGSLGPRIHEDSGTVKAWREMGGSFTESEQAHLAANLAPPPRAMSPEAQELGLDRDLTAAQKDFVKGLSTEERAQFMENKRADFKVHTDALDVKVQPHAELLKAAMPKAGSLATGIVSGIVAHQIMEHVDPEHKMNDLAEEASEGAIAGGVTTAGATALGASASLGPEVLAGAAAYVAGAESQKGITKALQEGGMDEAGAEAAGDVAGGAIGGTTAAVVGGAAVVGAATLAGAEVGEAVGIVGGPVGIAVGGVAGATIGAAIGGIGWLFSHH